MFDAILSLEIIDGPIPLVFYALSIAFVLYLIIRRPTARWVATALVGILAGAVIGAALAYFANVLNLVVGDLPPIVDVWVIGFFAALGLAVVNLWSSRWWRKVIAIISIVVFTLTTVVGVNAAYGLNKTVANLLGTTTAKPIEIGDTPKPTDTADPLEALYRTWKPPADMPKVGKAGSHVIPGTESHFVARPAGIYLPPAALTKNPPALPLVVMMMGQPGNPDPQYVAPILNAMAAKHNGLAPIVIVADQLGNPSVDPLCLDTKQHGNAEIYIMKDVVNWAKTHLNILHSRKYWTVAGYSNGGECATYFAAKYPSVWGNFGNLSGDAFAGDENMDYTLKEIFRGDQAAWDRTKPFNIFAANHGNYRDTVGIFTVGSKDTYYVGAVKKNYEAAKAAGVTATYFEIPGGDHGAVSVDGGIQHMFDVLYPRLGLSP